MQTANVLVALGGNRANTVPKASATAAEIAVLQAIHGVDAVHDIDPLDEDRDVSHREEFARLVREYPARDEDNTPIVQKVYPGAAPMLHETIAELGLDPTLFKVSARIVPRPAPRKAVARKPRPVAAAPDNSADHLFDDEEAADEAADVLR